ncbi:hypothetical protein [Streptomyces carpinensis]|uniref:Uncharacterized protein n=1 Tax=Streptomyces carpinensis TaxID=66369 RepID=A0ABV1VZS9_9ACTN|nr:hypothetical protein [Streptomyces carpinensis]
MSADALRTARTVRGRYAELKLDLVDSVNVVRAGQYETDTVRTLDRRDFGAILPLTPHPAFGLLPDDLQAASPRKGETDAASGGTPRLSRNHETRAGV